MKWYNYLVLRPHAKSLLTGRAALWLGYMLFIISVMAAIEAVSWGAISWFWMPQHLRMFSIMIGMAIFGLIWVVDAQLVLYDISKLNKDDPAGGVHGVFLRAIIGFLYGVFFTKFGWGILWRIFFVFISLMVTAPAVVSLMQWTDLDAEYGEKIGNIKKNLLIDVENHYKEDVTKMEATVREIQEQLAAEVRGDGLSGVRGVGPTARSIENELEYWRDKRKSRIEDYEKTRLEIGASSIDELRKKYAVTVPENTVLRKLDTFISNPKLMNNTAAHISGGFLILVFSALLILKLFQPDSVAIYLSEELQAAYFEYQNGRIPEINDGNPVESRHPNIEPFFFKRKYEEYVKNYKTQNEVLSKDRNLAQWRAALQFQGALLEETSAGLKENRARLNEIGKTLHQQKSDLLKSGNLSARLESEIELLREELKKWRKIDTTNFNGSQQMAWVEKVGEINDALKTLQENLHDTTNTASVLKEDHSLSEDLKRDIESQIALQKQDIVEIEKRIKSYQNSITEIYEKLAQTGKSAFEEMLKKEENSLSAAA